jgi:hypothetical protein
MHKISLCHYGWLEGRVEGVNPLTEHRNTDIRAASRDRLGRERGSI